MRGFLYRCVMRLKDFGEHHHAGVFIRRLGICDIMNETKVTGTECRF
jgi:hypothetical protein